MSDIYGGTHARTPTAMTSPQLQLPEQLASAFKEAYKADDQETQLLTLFETQRNLHNLLVGELQEKIKLLTPLKARQYLPDETSVAIPTFIGQEPDENGMLIQVMSFSSGLGNVIVNDNITSFRHCRSNPLPSLRTIRGKEKKL